MSFVKLDCAMLNSSIWPEKDQRDLFITALLMAEPVELREAMPQIAVNEIKNTGWKVPPGWYGLVRGASVGIISRAGIDRDRGLVAMVALGNPDPDSRSRAYDGRRMVRVDGGYIILNFIAYRERDASSAERSRRWRLREKAKQAKVEREAKKRAKGGTIRPEHLEDAP